jgi:peptide/nickel transport system permease protein
MSARLSRRLAQALLVLLGVSLVTFLMMHLAPGHPLQVNPELRLDPTAVERWLQLRELDKPLPAQYLAWLSRVFRGDFGVSLIYNRPVIELLVERLPATLLLTVTSFLIALAFALPLGMMAAAREGSFTDRAVNFISLCGISMPGFWLGMILVLLFSHHFSWLPPVGMRTPGNGGMVDFLAHMVMPVAVLSTGSFAYYVRYIRKAVAEILDQDFVRTAKAKGLSSWQVLYGHVLPNAVFPVITIVTLSLPMLFTGALVTEHVFSWPGMGRWIISATLSRDYPAIMAVNMYIAVLVTLSNFLADLLYLFCDPRVKQGL